MKLEDIKTRVSEGFQKYKEYRKQRSLSRKLGHACRYGTIAQIGALLAQGAHPDSKDTDGRNILEDALRMEKFDIAKALLEAGANPDVYVYNQSGLVRALETQQNDIACLMIEKGASVDVTQRGYNAPLITAIYRAKSETVMLMLDKGADVNACDYKGRTPLLAAVRRGDVALVQTLLDQGADATWESADRETPLDYAQRLQNREIEAALQSHLDALVPAWQKTAEQEVAHISIKRDAGYRITEIFNFETARRTTVTQNLETFQEAVFCETFDAVKDKTAIEAATTQLKKLGM